MKQLKIHNAEIYESLLIPAINIIIIHGSDV